MEKPRGRERQYILYNFHSIEQLALELVKNTDKVIKHLKIDWNRFPDNTPNIKIHGIEGGEIEDQDILFMADFFDYSTIMEQFAVLMVLCESFIHSLTIICPFFPTGTMERVTKEGEVATANTLAWIFNSLPRIANPTKVVIYDLHTLQNRFYFKGGALVKMATAVPIIFF
jgi:phosphoribosylpyrophosphate synthetase